MRFAAFDVTPHSLITGIITERECFVAISSLHAYPFLLLDGVITKNSSGTFDIASFLESVAEKAKQAK